MMETPSNILNSKAIPFGEFHGTTELNEVKIQLVERLLTRDKIVVILLERPYYENVYYDEWERNQLAPSEFVDKFNNPKTSMDTQTEFTFLKSLIAMKLSGHNINIIAVDISFKDEEVSKLGTLSKEIRSIDDEDLFDLNREKFIIERMAESKSVFDNADHVL